MENNSDFIINNCPACGYKAGFSPFNIYYIGDKRYEIFGIECQSPKDCDTKISVCITEDLDFETDLMIKLWNNIKYENK